MESSREARRRRILERGSDRLALITGRIQSLPSPSSSSAASSPYPSPRSNLDPRSPLPYQSSAVPNGGDNSRSTLLKSDSSTSTGSGHINAYNSGNRVEPHLRHNEMSNEASKAPAMSFSRETSNEVPKTPALEANRVANNEALKTSALEHSHKTSNEALKDPALEVSHKTSNEAPKAHALDSIKESSGVSSAVEKSSVPTSHTQQQSEPRTSGYRFFTPSQISSAVAASEGTRTLCSVAAAILVVLSYFGFPGLGNSLIKSITMFSPLYLLLLTNLTLVLAPLLSEKHKGPAKTRKVANKVPLESGDGWTDQVGMALEASLLLQKVLDSFFMDCSFYAIVVICGLSLGKLFS